MGLSGGSISSSSAGAARWKSGEEPSTGVGMAVWTRGLDDALRLLVLIHGDLLGRLLLGDFVVPRTADPGLQQPLSQEWDRMGRCFLCRAVYRACALFQGLAKQTLYVYPFSHVILIPVRGWNSHPSDMETEALSSVCDSESPYMSSNS